MKKIIYILLFILYTPLIYAGPPDYEFPTISSKYSKYEATVIGTLPQVTAQLPEVNPLKMDRIRIFKERVVPEPFFFDEELRYSFAWQKEKSPLVFLIAGTGASHNGGKNIMMAKAFYQAGFHVVSLSSPTFMNFIVAASETSVPGHAYKDAVDLYRVMEKIWKRYHTKIDVSDFYITGYSLGGFNTAFVMRLDAKQKVFNFQKALLINPPVNLYNSMSLLDRLADNIPGGADNFDRFFKSLLDEVSHAYRESDTVELNEEFLFKAFKAVDPSNEELAALIGVSFRLSSANLMYTADVMNKRGFIVPKDITLTSNTNQTEYMIMAQEIGFTDYFHSFFYPYFKEATQNLSREDFVDLMSLTAIEPFLSSNDNIEVIHNLDDIILEPGEIDFFRRVFGKRAKIYPKGGHCGNMSHRENVAHMIRAFKE